MAQIYYDPTGGFLYGIDSNGNPEIVKTDACVMMPENVFVDNIGKIHVKDLQGLDTCISDGQGNDAIIMGPIGPQGPEGPQGPQGQAVGISTIIPNTNNVTVVFTDGEQIVVNHGKDGTSIKLISSLSELPYTGKIGDSCLLVNRDYDQTQGYVDAGSLYEYNGNAWGLKGNIKGPKGDQGPQGPQGTPVTITKIDSSDPSKTLVTFSDGQSMSVYNGKDGQNGLPGANGTSIRLINSIADLLQSQSQTGDSYILTKSDYDGDLGETMEEGSVYEFNGNVHTYKFSIKGPKGDTGANGQPGAPGTKFLVPDATVTDELLGKGDPDLLPFNIAQIQDGDYTISADTQTIWVWNNAIINFRPLFSIKGEQGIQGVAGPVGPQGAKGDQGDSYFTQPVADKLTAIAGEYDSVKNEANDCTEKILELENRIAVLEGYITQLNSIDLSGLAVAYPKDVTPEEA